MLPAASRGFRQATTSLPSIITSQCTGRTNSMSRLPQRMRRGTGNSASASATMRRQQLRGALARNSPRKPASPVGSRAVPARIPHAATFGERHGPRAWACRSASNATLQRWPALLDALGPAASSQHPRISHRQAARRGERTRARRAAKPGGFRRCRTPRRKLPGPRSAFGGSSSVPISTRKSAVAGIARSLRSRRFRRRTRGVAHRKAERLAARRNSACATAAPARARAGCSAGAR